ncbi:hypothetical protein QTP86_023636 [Hemibagrus guttatus]|nr:hypothetical protein QTP86_023636 [Hemibagrus guttatus]
MRVIVSVFLAIGKIQEWTTNDLNPSQSTLTFKPYGKKTSIVGLSGFVGAVDETHVRVIAPTVNEETYINRKEFTASVLCLMPVTKSWILCQNGQGQHMMK